MLHIGRARHAGPGKRHFAPGQLSVEFVNVGGWLTYGKGLTAGRFVDLALACSLGEGKSQMLLASFGLMSVLVHVGTSL